MADTKISALTSASALAGTEVLPLVQSGSTKKITAATLAASGLTGLSAAGTAALPGLAVGETTTGLWRPSVGVLAASVGGVEALRISGGAIDVRGGNVASIFGADSSHGFTRTDATNKRFILGFPHRLNAEENIASIHATSSTSSTILAIGGGLGTLNAVTMGQLWATSSNTVLTGSEMLRWTVAGVRIQVGVSADPSYLLHVYSTTKSQDVITGAESSGNVGLATSPSATAKVHVKQPDSAAAITALRIEQLDVDDSFIDFVGTTAADATKSLSSLTVATIKGYARCEVNGVDSWIPLYNAPTA